MSNKLSALKLLYDECKSYNPDMTKIDEYIIRCCTNKEDINTVFQCNALTLLHIACSMGHHEIVMRLLENSYNFKYSIDVNAICNDETPLHFACRKHSSLTVRALLLHPNIDINKVNTTKATPLHYACGLSSSKEVLIELLKHRRINVNAMNNWCRTPLHTACFHHGNIVLIVQLLLEHGTITDINATDYYGDTPLHIACSNDHSNKEKIIIIRNLLKQPSIIIDKKNNNNETPLEICKRRLDDPSYAHDEIIQLFEYYQ